MPKPAFDPALRQRAIDALTAAALFAVDPHALGGVAIRSPAGPIRDAWLTLTRRWLADATPWRRVPLGIADGRLLGGLDLPATLAAGRPVAERGLLAESDGGVVVLAMAERLTVGTVARIASALDDGRLRLARDGIQADVPARIAVIALDEGLEADETLPTPLADRLAFRLGFDGLRALDADTAGFDAEGIALARARVADVTVPEPIIEALAQTADAIGVDAPRALWLATRAARAAAALDGHDTVSDDHAAIAARLVLAPRATRLPTAEAPPETEDSPDADDAPLPDVPPPPPSDADAPDNDADRTPPPAVEQALEDVLLAAAQAAIPADLLAALRAGQSRAGQSRAAGRAGAVQKAAMRGRPVGSRRSELRPGSRLALIDTLRAAAPWQGLRRAARSADGGSAPCILIRREDFHIQRLEQRRETTTIFVVDASGSAALHRLAEAKGAVELLLADCYVRRDRVAVIAFRGSAAELLLPPTRSLVRAKRSLAGLPGGGGTPLATALDAACELADTLARRGETPGVVLLTDGRANVGRDGRPGRPQAEEDAVAAARRLALAGHACLFIDTAPRPQPQAAQLAVSLRARYLPLPHADARVLSAAVRGGLAAR